MMGAYQKDVWRSILKGWKRFLSILAITALGVGMLTGLYAACEDMYYSADAFFDAQNLFDIRILSTLGLTQEDVEALAQVEGVEMAEGAYYETLHTDVNGVRKSVEMTVLSKNPLNIPYLLAGKLPTKPGEIAVTQKYLHDSGKALGDTLSVAEDLDNGNEAEELAAAEDESSNADEADLDTDIELDMEVEIEEEAEDPTFLHTNYTISGVVMDPKDIRGDGQANVFRSTSTTDYAFFVCAEDAKTDVYTAVYLSLSGTRALNAFDSDYEQAVQRVIDEIERRIKAQRTKVRYEAVVLEANEKIAEAEGTMKEKFAEADQKFADAWGDIADAKEELDDGEVTIKREERSAKKKISEAWEEIFEGKRDLAEAADELMEGERKLKEGLAEYWENADKLKEGKAQLKVEREKAEAELSTAEKALSAAEEELTAARQQLDTSLFKMQGLLGDAWPAAQWNALVEAARDLASTGADAEDIAKGTAAQSAALGSAMQAAISARLGALRANLAELERAIGELWDTLESAKANADRLQAVLLEKEDAEKKAAEEHQAQYQLLLEMKADPEADEEAILAQQEAVELAAKAESDAKAEADFARAALNAANTTVSGLQSELLGLNKQAEQLQTAIGALDTQGASLPSQAVQAALGMGQTLAGQAQLDAQRIAFEQQKAQALAKLDAADEELAEGERKLQEGWLELQDGIRELEQGKAKWLDGQIELMEGEAELTKKEADAKKEIEKAKQDLAEGWVELEDGRSKLLKKEREYADKKLEAYQQLADARAELADIDMTEWYVQDRTSLESYASLSSDLSSIEAVGRVFPVIFLLVAVLISLTTMTRMVEEERGLIGLYKALGFTDVSVYLRYILFAFIACLLGGALGDLFGFVLMPKFIVLVLEELYHLPNYYLRFDLAYGVGGVLLFMVGIIGATMLACRSELAQVPAALMRPKAPRAGARVMLERMPAIWNRLKFLDKVTVRNLFRYKKRLFMTVGGIMGCTALILCGFAIKDSIADLEPKQYDNIYRYDLLAVFEEDENAAMIDELSADENIADLINLRMESVKLINQEGRSEKVQLMAVPKDAAFEDYIRLETPFDTVAKLDDSGVLVTQNAANLLGLRIGDSAFVQTLDLVQREVKVVSIVRNYMGNNVFMTAALYEALFEEYQPNGVLAHMSPACADHIAYADGLIDNDSIVSAMSKAALKENFGFDLVNALVLLITAMAGGLAFVVLFTLSNTNISERVRELSTIKVLGFYDSEVHQYVNTETLILTVVGILLGLPLGRFISGFLTAALNMPSIYFAVYVAPKSYVISAGLTFSFALMVNLLTNRTLGRIDMVEALKSVE